MKFYFDTQIIRAAESIKKGTREIILIKKEAETKTESARIFSEKYYLAKNDEVYQALMKEHKEKYENGD